MKKEQTPKTKKPISKKEQLDIIFPQTILNFEKDIKKEVRDKLNASHDPKHWFKLKTVDEKVQFIFSCDYWLPRYTCFLLSALTAEIFKD